MAASERKLSEQQKNAGRGTSPAWGSSDDRLNQLGPCGRNLAGIVVEETDGFERIHGCAEAPVTKRAPVHALHTLETIFLNVRKRIAVVKLLQLIRGIHAD